MVSIGNIHDPVDKVLMVPLSNFVFNEVCHHVFELVHASALLRMAIWGLCAHPVFGIFHL